MPNGMSGGVRGELNFSYSIFPERNAVLPALRGERENTMFIVRVSSKNKQEQEIRTFTFDTERDMEKAVSALKKTTCKGFSADVDSADAHKGKIRDMWDRSTKYISSLSRTVQFGAYKDSITEVFGLKEECSEAATKTNEAICCWASRKAVLAHVAGDLYKVTYIDPYTD